MVTKTKAIGVLQCQIKIFDDFLTAGNHVSFSSDVHMPFDHMHICVCIYTNWVGVCVCVCVCMRCICVYMCIQNACICNVCVCSMRIHICVCV